MRVFLLVLSVLVLVPAVSTRAAEPLQLVEEVHLKWSWGPPQRLTREWTVYEGNVPAIVVLKVDRCEDLEQSGPPEVVFELENTKDEQVKGTYRGLDRPVLLSMRGKELTIRGTPSTERFAACMLHVKVYLDPPK